MKTMKITLALLIGAASLAAWMNDPSPEASKQRGWMSSLIVNLLQNAGR